jgi:hypothetical protein
LDDGSGIAVDVLDQPVRAFHSLAVVQLACGRGLQQHKGPFRHYLGWVRAAVVPLHEVFLLLLLGTLDVGEHVLFDFLLLCLTLL